jgi:hypothetical protein
MTAKEANAISARAKFMRQRTFIFEQIRAAAGRGEFYVQFQPHQEKITGDDASILGELGYTVSWPEGWALVEWK